MVTQTSLLAYKEILPTLGKRQQQILDIFAQHIVLTDQEIATYSSLPINCVTPRRNELENKGYIIKLGNKVSQYTNKLVSYYRIIPSLHLELQKQNPKMFPI